LTDLTKTVWAIRVPPDDEDDTLHEFFLLYYRFSDSAEESDPHVGLPAEPAVFIRFQNIDQLKRFQAQFTEAKLGPSSAFTEGILFTKSWEEAILLQKKVCSVLLEDSDDEIADAHAEDALEDI
jgi:hypothetical protein